MESERCQYCNGDKMTQKCLPDPRGVKFGENGIFVVIPNQHGGYMLADVCCNTGITQYAEISHCPMCGRKLED